MANLVFNPNFEAELAEWVAKAKADAAIVNSWEWREWARENAAQLRAKKLTDKPRAKRKLTDGQLLKRELRTIKRLLIDANARLVSVQIILNKLNTKPTKESDDQ